MPAHRLCIRVQLKKWMQEVVKNEGPEELRPIIKSSQTGTRTLQNVCSEAKVRKLGAVARMVPGAKKQLERLIHFYKVCTCALCLSVHPAGASTAPLFSGGSSNLECASTRACQEQACICAGSSHCILIDVMRACQPLLGSSTTISSRHNRQREV